MSIVQISAALGPAECELAVKHTFEALLKDAKKHQINIQIIEENKTQYGFSSILLHIADDANEWIQSWLGTIQWVFKSPFRPNHKRKNWFVGIQLFPSSTNLPNDDTIIFKACRASGSGGQHINTTDSAVHATHVSSGISVKVMSERSQHANKRLAKELIALKLQQIVEKNSVHQKQKQHEQHASITRGNAIKVFNLPSKI